MSVRVVGWPEYGFTRTGTDGVFSLVVNGGEPLTLEFAAEGYLPIRRTEHARPVDYTWYPDVVMTALDSARTVVHLSSLSTVQTAIASPTSDASGERQSILLFFPGTQATLMNENGTTESLSTLTVHSTEYTVGEQGPKAMPAPLPPSSGYTYAVEFTAEEAMATNVKQLTFSQPVINYVDNFLHLPVGTPVPSGYFDRATGGWVPAPNGLVIKVLDSLGGLAEIDADGDDLPDSADSLVALGIGDNERSTLASLYIPGQSLWRVPVSHFTPWDFNLGFSPPADAVYPPDLDPQPENGNDPDSCQQTGSVVDCHNQILGERVNIVGTPFSLAYTSSRAASYGAGSGRANIPISQETVPPDLKRIELTVQVAGQVIRQSFAPLPDQTTVFDWDGRDVFGRDVAGSQPALITVQYVYPAAYGVPLSTLQRAFGAFTDFPDIPIEADLGRLEFSLPHQWVIPLERPSALTQEGLGGWTLNVHHSYDPAHNRLTRGDALVSSAVTSNLSQGFGSIFHWSYQPAADGSLYLSNIFQGGPGPNLLNIAPNGTSTVVAAGFAPTLIALDGKRVLFARQVQPAPDQLSQVGQIERLNADGSVTLVAGSASCSDFGLFSGDEGPAIDACLGFINDIDVAPDGQVYVTAQDNDSTSVRRIDSAGTIHNALNHDVTQHYDVLDLGIAPDYSIYILTRLIGGGNVRTIRSVRPDGTVSLIAGSDDSVQDCSDSDGSNGVRDHLCGGAFLAVASNGAIYATNTIQFESPMFPGEPVTRHAVVTIRPDGRIAELFTGQQQVDVTSFKLAADGGIVVYARLAAVNPPSAFQYYQQIPSFFDLRPSLPRISDVGYAVPSEDGREVYSFDDQGRHLATYDGLVGATKYQFSYGANGYLTEVTDTDGRTTSIQRDGSGHPTAIVSPTGQTTTLAVDSNGYLALATSPGGAQQQFEYSNGLLVHEIDARGGVHQFTYDANGRLVEDRNPIGGGWTISRGPGGTVTMASGEARTRVYSAVDALGAQGTVGPELLGNRQRSVTTPDGLVVTSQIDSQGNSSVFSPDGTVVQTTLAPDPRFGMAAPFVASQTVTTPSGLLRSTSTTRAATLNADGHLSLASQTETTVVNGNTSTITYDAASRTSIVTSPLGRQTTIGYDTHSRMVFTQRGTLAPASFLYDPSGRLTSVAVGAGPDVRLATFTYDTSDRPTVLTDPLSQNTSLAYDADNRVTSQIGPAGDQLTLSHSAAGDVTSLGPPGRPSHHFTYTAAGDQASYQAPTVGGLSQSTTYSYNLDRQRTIVAREGGTTMSFAYDPAGRLASLTYSLGNATSGTVTRLYSPATGLLTRHIATDGATLDYAYDGRLLVSTTWGGAVAGTVSRTWDNDFHVATESVNGENTTAFTYDSDGLIIQSGDLIVGRDPINGLIATTTLGGVTDTRGYDAFAQRLDYEALYEGTSIYQSHQILDRIGRTEVKTETADGVVSTYAYAYDSAGRLWQTMKDGLLTSTYLYDPNGNRLSKTSPSGTEIGTYDDQDRQLAYGKWTYAYTASGDLKTKTDTATGDVTTYTYDGVGNLRRVDLPGGRVIEYLIDAKNRRVGKKVDGILVKGWLYRNSLAPVAELDGNNVLVARFVFATNGSVPSYIVREGSTYRVVTDDLGTPRRILNVATGSVAQARDLDEFGNTLSDSAPDFQPFGFAGGLYDPDTGLVRFGARDYDTASGRWTSTDPVRFLFTTNLYSYGGNDPVNRLDPTGLGPQDKWYGYNERNFQNWVHRQMKDDGQADFTKDEVKQLYEDWKAQGKPGGDKSNKPGRGGGRQCENPSEPMSTGESGDPESDLDPGSDPGSDPQNSPFTPFQGPGPFYEDGRPVNPVPIVPGMVNPSFPALGPIEFPFFEPIFIL